MAHLLTKDIRSHANKQRRHKNARAKWKYSKTWPTVVSPSEDETRKRSRPLKALGRYVPLPKPPLSPVFRYSMKGQSHHHNNAVTKTFSSHPWVLQQGRLHDTIFAKLEGRDFHTEADLYPRGSGTLGNLDEVYHSLDADASQASSLGLNYLVEQAIAVATAKEVERLIKDEYEVLDSGGERVNVSKNYKTKTALNMDTEDVDGDWETI